MRTKKTKRSFFTRVRCFSKPEFALPLFAHKVNMLNSWVLLGNFADMAAIALTQRLEPLCWAASSRSFSDLTLVALIVLKSLIGVASRPSLFALKPRKPQTALQDLRCATPKPKMVNTEKSRERKHGNSPRELLKTTQATKLRTPF